MDSKGRGLFLILISGGTRIGETLSVNLEDLDLDNDPPMIRLNHNTKSGNRRIVFISEEAKLAIKEWLKYRY